MITQYSKMLFLKGYDYGAIATPYFNTDIVTTQSGAEQRNGNWIEPLHDFSVTYSIQNEDEIDYLKNFFMQHRGPLISFKFKDWTDYNCKRNAGRINEDGLLNGKPYAELYKIYQVTDTFEPTYRRIKVIAKSTDEDSFNYKPFKMYMDNVEFTNYILDADEGIVRFNSISSSIITTISNENNCLITTAQPHLFVTGDKIWIDSVAGGDDKINDRLFTITKVNDTSFRLNYSTINFGSMANGRAYKYPQNTTSKIEWTGLFYCRVRWAEDPQPISADDFKMYTMSVRLRELK